MPPPGQRTFVPVPTTLGIQSLLARPDSDAIQSHPPMISRAIHEAYRKRTRAVPTEVEQRRAKLEAARDKKEREKEKSRDKAKAAREKKAEKERAEREERRRAGLPAVEVAASQATIAGFFRGTTGGLERRREVGGVGLVRPEGNKENEEPGAKRQKVEEEEGERKRAVPSRKRVFGRNLPLKVLGDEKLGRASLSPKKKLPPELQKHESGRQSTSQPPCPKRETASAGSPARKRLRSSPVEPEDARGKESTPKTDPAPAPPRENGDAVAPKGNQSTSDIDRVAARAGQETEAVKPTPARERMPSIKRTTSMRSESNSAAFSKPTPIPTPPSIPTAAPSKTHPPARTRAEPTNVPHAPPPHRPSPPLFSDDRMLSKPPENPTSAHSPATIPPATHPPGPGPRNPHGPLDSGNHARPLPKVNCPAMSPAAPPAKAPPVAPSLVSSKPQGLGVSGYPSAGAQARAHATPMPPPRRPPIVPPKQHGPLGSGHPSARPPANAQPPQKPSGKPPTTKSAVPRYPPISHPKPSTCSEPPSITAASFGYLPAAQKPAVPAFVRPTRPHAVPVFKPQSASSRPTGFQKPRFLSRNIAPTTPTNTGVQGTGIGKEPPLSTQMFLETRLESLLPSPSQEARELEECSSAPVPPKPTFINRPPTATSRPQRPQFLPKPPVPLFSKTPAPRPKPMPIPRHPSSVNPLRLQVVKQMDDPLPFISTQDLAFSSQDIREVEESDTPSKPPPRPHLGQRLSPLSNSTPSTARVDPPSLALPSASKGPANDTVPQRTPIQPANPPADRRNPALSPFGSCSDRPQFFNSQASDDPIELMMAVAENIKACQELEEERKREQQEQGQQQEGVESCGGGQGPGALLSQETDYGDLDFDAVDLEGF